MIILEEAIAVRRYRLIAYLDRNIDKGWTDKNITPLLQNLPAELKMDNAVNWRTICRWRQQYLESNCCLTSLVPSKGTGYKTVRRTDDEALLIPMLNRMIKLNSVKVSVHYREYAEEVDAYNSLVLEASRVISKLTYKSFKTRYVKLKEINNA
jgi:putative transposase